MGQCKMQTADWLRTIVFRVRKQWDYCCHVLICMVKTIVRSLRFTLTALIILLRGYDSIPFISLFVWWFSIAKHQIFSHTFRMTDLWSAHLKEKQQLLRDAIALLDVHSWFCRGTTKEEDEIWLTFHIQLVRLQQHHDHGKLPRDKSLA